MPRTIRRGRTNTTGTSGPTKIDAASLDAALGGLSEPVAVDSTDLREEIQALRIAIEEHTFILKLINGLS